MCMRAFVCVCVCGGGGGGGGGGDEALTFTFMHGFQNNLAHLFSLRRRSAI